jgi:hypothetical protein
MMRVIRALICVVTIAAAYTGCRTPGAAEQGLRISCGAKLGVNEENASRRDWGSDQRGWTAEAIGDTLLVMRKGQCGDECTYTDELVFVDIHHECPTLLRATTTRIDHGSPVKASPKAIDAQKGALAIQDWDFARGVVSGRLAAEFEVTFYAVIPKEHR